ncbi:MAG: hypothetical protein AB1505_33970 [Candidatus Latescibacterota bacterium]
MKVFRHLPDGSRFHYYIEHDDQVTLWYPEMTWVSKVVTAPEGRLLAEGSVERVLFQVRDGLPPDLLRKVRESLQGTAPPGRDTTQAEQLQPRPLVPDHPVLP